MPVTITITATATIAITIVITIPIAGMCQISVVGLVLVTSHMPNHVNIFG